MKDYLLLAAVVVCCGCAAVDAQVQNDWQTRFTDESSNAHSVASLVFYGTGENVTHSVQGSNEDWYFLDWGSYSEADARLDDENYSYVESWSGGTSESLHDWHTVRIQVGRKHRSVVDEPLAYAEGETYFDASGVVSIEARKDGLAFCKIVVEDDGLPDKHIGPEPLICDGLTLRASVHGTHVTYEFNAGLWRWERSGEVYHYLDGANVVSPITSETYSGYRGLNQQNFYWWVKVQETDIVEIYCDINGSMANWEPFRNTVSQQSGSFTISQDIWDIDASVHKTIDDLP